MPKRSSTRKRRARDENEAAFDAVQHVIALTEEAEKQDRKNPAAVALGRLGGLRGGRVRAERLTPSQRREIAVRAVRARWKKAR